jgi:nucleoid-associated protein YgaU
MPHKERASTTSGARKKESVQKKSAAPGRQSKAHKRYGEAGSDSARAARGASGAPVQASAHESVDDATVNRQIQMMMGYPDSEASVHEAAASGIEGSGQALPHLDTIQSSFGTHDVTGVTAHMDSAAAQASTAMGAEAYATSDHVAFKSAPELHTAAHEAAHVVQQRGGVQLAGGVGQAGDSYEKHADAVADKVVEGESAEAMLDAYAGQGTGSQVQGKAIQRLEGDPPSAGRQVGGQDYVIKLGDTLWGIATRTYGEGRYWRDIMKVNPKEVANGGDLIITGRTLFLPVITIGGGETPAPKVEDPAKEEDPAKGEEPQPPQTDKPEEPKLDGGQIEAKEPRGECNEWGDFLIYPDDFPGTLPKKGADGIEHIRESEYQPLIDERKAEAEAKREAAVSDMEELLSYGAFDWAITDSEATRALNLIGSLHFSQIKPAIDQLGTKFINRLLDNLPAAAQKTEAFAKFVVALGPAKARPYVEELLSYSLFDWAITDNDINAVAIVLNQLPLAEQAELITGMSMKFQVRFATNLPLDANVSDEFLKRFFDAMPDEQMAALQAIMSCRFNFDVNTRDSGKWTADGLRRAWEILEQLPPEHVQNNTFLDKFLVDGPTDGSGYYRASDDSAVVGYSDLTKTGSYGRIMVGGTEKGLHSSVNLFDTVVRHEIGHAVDAKLGVSTNGYATTAASAGKWKTYGSQDDWKAAIIAEAGGFSGHGYPDEEKYKKAFDQAVDDGVDFNTALGKVDSTVAKATATTAGPVAAVFEKKQWHPATNPWYDNPDRPGVNGRVFHKAYDWGKWVSFDRSARPTYGISGYQWRAPGEWFAEVYACFYSDQDGIDGNPVGTRLASRDSATAEWFAKDVDKGHSLQEETGQDKPVGEKTE